MKGEGGSSAPSLGVNFSGFAAVCFSIARGAADPPLALLAQCAIRLCKMY